MSDLYVPGLGGFRTAKQAAHRVVFRQGTLESFLAQGKIINGSLSRDALNTGDENVLRAGTLMGKITATGLYRPSVIGVSNLAYADNDTTIQVPLAVAQEVARLKTVGGGGNLSLNFIGPPSAAGTVATTALTVTAVTLNGATSTLTVGDLNLAKVVGSLITPADGSEVPITLVADGYGILVTDSDGFTSLNVPFAEMPIAGVIEAAQIINWPADSSTKTYIRTSLSTASGGKFVFSDQY